MTTTPTTATYETYACMAADNDNRRDPGRCVVANHIRDLYPWAKHVTVGKKTIKVYDYRCEHNPTGQIGKCDLCPGRALRFATALPLAKAITEYDRGGDPVFPRVQLREDEAEILPATQDKVRKREAMREYHRRVQSGEHVPNKRSAKAKARIKSNRRKG